MAIIIKGKTTLAGGVRNSTGKKTNIKVTDGATLTTPSITNTGNSTYDVSLGTGGTLNYAGKEYTNQPQEDYYAKYLADIEKANAAARRQAEEAQRMRTQAALEANNAYIPQVNQQTDKQLQDAYIAKQRARVEAPQALSAMGYTGGATESSLLGLDTNYQNARGQIEQGRNEAIDKIRQNANQIRATGDANLSDVAAQYYQNMLASQNQALAAAQSQKNWQAEFDARQTANTRDEFLNTIGAYSNDYQAQINKVRDDGDPTNDWQIAYLNAARNQKISGINQSKAEAEQQAFENRLKAMETQYKVNKPYYKPAGGLTYSQALQSYLNGIVTPEVLAVLGVEE